MRSSEATDFWVGVDVGGTFTDVVVYDEATATLRVGKSPTDPADPTQGLLHAFAKLEVALPATERLVHGTTIGTNAILERKGAPVWVVTTRGFGDTLEIARTNRTVLYDIRALKPASLVPRQRVLEVDERMAFDGSVLCPLDTAGVDAAAERIRAVADGGSPGAAAICFLHSYANPAHEETAARLVRERLPGWFVCTSREVLPEWREYERFSTAVLNAYIGTAGRPLPDDTENDARGARSRRHGLHHDLERRHHDRGGRRPAFPCTPCSRGRRAAWPRRSIWGGSRGRGT